MTSAIVAKVDDPAICAIRVKFGNPSAKVRCVAGTDLTAARTLGYAHTSQGGTERMDIRPAARRLQARVLFVGQFNRAADGRIGKTAARKWERGISP